MTRFSKQCWRCKYFSDNLPEHFKAIANASGETRKSCTHGQDLSAPPPCPQFVPLHKSKEKVSHFSSGTWGDWRKMNFWQGLKRPRCSLQARHYPPAWKIGRQYSFPDRANFLQHNHVFRPTVYPLAQGLILRLRAHKTSMLQRGSLPWHINGPFFRTGM